MKKLFFSIALFSVMLFACKKDNCSKPDSCSLVPQAGPCEAIKIRYYYDADQQKCMPFEWGGCQGVVPFETLEACSECECNKNMS